MVRADRVCEGNSKVRWRIERDSEADAFPLGGGGARGREGRSRAASRHDQLRAARYADRCSPDHHGARTNPGHKARRIHARHRDIARHPGERRILDSVPVRIERFRGQAQRVSRHQRVGGRCHLDRAHFLRHRQRGASRCPARGRRDRRRAVARRRHLPGRVDRRNSCRAAGPRHRAPRQRLPVLVAHLGGQLDGRAHRRQLDRGRAHRHGCRPRRGRRCRLRRSRGRVTAGQDREEREARRDACHDALAAHRRPPAPSGTRFRRSGARCPCGQAMRVLSRMSSRMPLISRP